MRRDLDLDGEEKTSNSERGQNGDDREALSQATAAAAIAARTESLISESAGAAPCPLA